MTVRPFGQLADGSVATEITLAAGALSARILSYGAILADLAVASPSGPRSLVLGFDRLEDYVAQDAYLGAIAGRCANRIRDGRFTLDGRPVELARNDGGRHHLHGGHVGFDKRLWRILEHSPTKLHDLVDERMLQTFESGAISCRPDDSVRSESAQGAAPAAVDLALTSPAGEEGYPGTVEVRCRYALDPDGLTIDLTAETDAPTLVNLAPHAYFALDDGPTILDHGLCIRADRYTPVDDGLIPTGEIRPVDGTPFDFRTSRPVRAAGRPLDHNFVLAAAPSSRPREAARLSSPRSGVTLVLSTTEPGLQVYDGNALAPRQTLRGGRPMVRNAGICLEPQRFPDAINHPHFAGAVLRPGETYRHRTRYDLVIGP